MTNERAISFTVNDRAVEVKAPPMTRLLDVLRHELQLTGTKEGCGEGECGACAVLVSGVLVNSCLVPVIQIAGEHVTTIEGIAPSSARVPSEAPAADETLSRIQEAYVSHGGAQCGICTPGMILATFALLAKNANPDSDAIRQGLAGNFCRCTGYATIVEAALHASKEAP